MRATFDDPFCRRPGRVDIAFGVDMHEFDPMAIVRKHLGAIVAPRWELWPVGAM